MAYQLSTVRTRVQQRIRDTGYSSSEIDQAINDTQNDVFNEYLLPQMQTSQNYTLTADVSDITNGVGLPANYSEAITLINTTTGQESVIPYKRVDLSDDWNPDQDDQPANYPEYWYFYDNTIRLYPKPAGAYTVKLRYYKKPIELVADEDVPEIPSEHSELLVSGASYRILQVKDNYDQAGIHQNKYDELLQKFVMRSTQIQAGQVMIMPTNTYPISRRF